MNDLLFRYMTILIKLVRIAMFRYNNVWCVRVCACVCVCVCVRACVRARVRVRVCVLGVAHEGLQYTVNVNVEYQTTPLIVHPYLTLPCASGNIF